MDITVNAGTLRAAASWVAGVAPKKAASPVFSGVHLAAENGELRLSATDYELFVATTIPVEVRKPGRVVVSAHLLDAITVTVRPAENLTLCVTDRGVRVNWGRAHWVLPTLDLREWPIFPEPGDEVGSVDAGVFTEALARTVPMASTSADESFLSGVQITFDSQLVLAATNRYRLAVAEVPWRACGERQPGAVMVPADVLRAVRDILKGTEGTLAVHVGDTITFATPHHRVTGHLIDTEFFQWKPLLPHPRDATTTVAVDTAELKAALTRVSVSESSATIQVTLGISSEEVTVRLTHDPDAAAVTVPVNVVGEVLTMVCSQRYLRDALAVLGSPMAMLHFFGGPTAAFLVTAADEHGEPTVDGYRHLVMPIRSSGRRVAETTTDNGEE